MGKDSGSLKDLWLGIGITVGIYIVGLIILLTGSMMILGYMMIAVIALIVIPIISFAMGKTRFGQGTLIGLGVNILLFSACFGIMSNI